MERRWYRRAFTLVELLVVIAIIAILAVVSIVGYSIFTVKAQNSVAQQELTQFIELLLSADMESEYFEVTNDGLILTTQKAKWNGDEKGFEFVDKLSGDDNKEGETEKKAITCTKNVGDKDLEEKDFNKLFVINDMLRWTGAPDDREPDSAKDSDREKFFDIRLLLEYGMLVDLSELKGTFSVEWAENDESTIHTEMEIDAEGKESIKSSGETPETNESRFIIESVSYELPNGGKATYEFIGSKDNSK